MCCPFRLFSHQGQLNWAALAICFLPKVYGSLPIPRTFAEQMKLAADLAQFANPEQADNLKGLITEAKVCLCFVGALFVNSGWAVGSAHICTTSTPWVVRWPKGCYANQPPRSKEEADGLVLCETLRVRDSTTLL